MTKKCNPHETRKKIAFAALKIADRSGWEKTTVEKAAKTCKIPVKTAKELLPEKDDMIRAIVEFIGTESKKVGPSRKSKKSSHDVLFDLFMFRYDALQQHRRGVLSIFKYCLNRPTAALVLLRSQWDFIKKINQLSKSDKPSPPRLARDAILMAVYLSALECWANDDSRDLSKTMARLDKSLRIAFNLMAKISK